MGSHLLGSSCPPLRLFLGLALTPSHKAITLDRKHSNQSLTVPTTKDEVQSFVGMAGFLHAWIPFFSLLAHPLCEAAFGSSHKPFLVHITSPFHKLQQALPQTPTLHPYLTQPFSLYDIEKEGYALRVLDHPLAPSFAPVEYISKKNWTILPKGGHFVCLLWPQPNFLDTNQEG